jgi:DNA (cytosine-5)-methyltransferase 1
MVMGPKRRAAWRVLDAQYFGVAQRRRRVFVVASSRDDFDPAEVLFEREGLRRDTAPSRKQGEEAAATIASRFGISRNNHGEVVTHVEEVAPTLTKEGTGVSRTGFQEDGWYVAQVFDRQRSDQYGESDIASTMSARDYKDATDLVAQPIPINTQLGLRGDTSNTTREGIGIGKEGDPMFTLQAAHSHAIAQPIALAENIIGRQPMNGGNGGGFTEDGLMYTLNATEVHGVAQPMAFQETADYVVAYNISPGKGELKNDIHVTDAHISKTIDASASNPAMHQGGAAIVQAMAVRRLTPRECERLQGFPDDYTAILGAADGPRYKSLGNSMAVPVMAWIGRRIDREHR